MLVTYVTLEWADGQETKHVSEGRSFDEIKDWWEAALEDDGRVRSFEMRTPTEEEVMAN